MSWQVILPEPEGGKYTVVETFDSPRAAQRGLMIFTAHELKNGRVARYRIDPPVDLDPNIDNLNLPDWALEALRKERL